MIKFFGCVTLLTFLCQYIYCQKQIIAGPMPGHVELRTARIWLQFHDNVKEATVFYRPATKPSSKIFSQHMSLPGGEFNTTVFTLTALDPGTTYSYYVSAGIAKKYLDSGKFTTQSLWQFRNPPADFSFIAGSCNYLNQPEYDKPGEPYGQDSSIFETMAKEKSSFMLWLGDNWYTRYPDFWSEWGLNFRPSHERRMPVMQKFLKAMPHYAIWDDHDYGPNDADKSYVLKEASRKTFMKFWANPSYGMNDQGVYTMFNYNDADFFMLDGRWWRSSDRLKDSIGNDINKNKKMFGDEQMEWLKNALLFSKANAFTKFRVIVAGSQFLNQITKFDATKHFPAEYYELLSFLEEYKINGVLFISGDRHHSEILKLDRKAAYTLYDVTVSPLTSHVAKTQGDEINNPNRVGKEVDAQNYGRFTISGEGKERKLSVEYLGKDGIVLEKWSIKASDLAF